MFLLSVALVALTLGFCWKLGCWLGDIAVRALSKRLDKAVPTDSFAFPLQGRTVIWQEGGMRPVGDWKASDHSAWKGNGA